MGYRLTLLTFFLLFTALQSPAQRHVKRHGQHASRLPDSVSTSDEEIKADAPPVVESPAVVVTPPAATDTAAQVDGIVKSDTTTTTATEEPEPAPVLRKIPDSAIRAWKDSHDFDYANDLSLWKQDPPEEENFIEKFFNSDAWRYIIYIILGAALLFALYKIITENNLRFFYRKPARLKETPLTEYELPEENLDELLQKALAAKEYRLATRYLYLKTLRQLDARQMIRLQSQATDEEYLRQMDKQPQGARFRWLTGVYERVWYGKFSVDDSQFSRLSQYFQEFHNSIGHPNRS